SSRRRTFASRLKWRARKTAAAPAVGLRSACGAGPRTVFGTVPPPRRVHSFGDDYVPILTRYRLDFVCGAEQNGKIPAIRQPNDPVDSLSTRFRRDCGDPTAVRALFGD